MVYEYKATFYLAVNDGPLQNPKDYFDMALYYGEKHQDFTLFIDGDVVLVEEVV